MKKTILLFAIIFAVGISAIKAQGCGDPAGETSSEDGAKIFGFFQPQFDYNLTDPNTSTFKFKRARIGLSGTIPYDFYYYVVMENSAFVSQSGYPYLLDAFISYRRFEWMNISMGSFKMPFGLEVNTACNALHTIERAIVSDQIATPQRDMGLMAIGNFLDKKINYTVALMNGRGLGIKDNNLKKDFIGRLRISPIEAITVGGSFRYGYPNTDDATRMSYAAEAQVKFGEFLLQGEYIYDEGDYNRGAGGGCGSEPLTLGEKRNGAWVHAMYLLPFNLQPVVKWEFFDTDNAIADNSIYRYTFGANYFFNDNTRLQLNYLYNVEKGAETPNDAVMMQLQIKF
jgi:hypothetical protein